MRHGGASSIALAVAAACAACGPSPMVEHAREPVVLVRVPADRVIACAPDDGVDIDDDGSNPLPACPPRRDIEYVRLSEWQAPSSVREFEAEHPPRGTAPLAKEFPKLTLHRAIPEPSLGVYGWYFGRRRR